MNNFAPVLIPTLNRHLHFKRCVESLAECTHAEKTDLHIALDYPLNESHWEGYKKIANYVNEIKGFKTVVIIKRNENFGVLKNYFEGQKEIFRKYDRIIFSEDDNKFSPNFLDYINKGLDKFEGDPQILAICGYNYPLRRSHYQFDYYYYKGFSAWGYGMWRNRYKKFFYTPEQLINFAKDYKFIKKLNTTSEKHVSALFSRIAKNKSCYGDGAICLDLVKYNMFCVFPSISKVRNYGHDGTGVHCGVMTNNLYRDQHIDNEKYFEYSGCVLKYDCECLKELNLYFSLTIGQKIKMFIKYIFIRVKFFKTI